jgi:hypothetical protein
MLDACGAGIAAVQPTDAGASAEAGLRSLLASFVAFETSMCAHLLEEEEVGLPLLRHHFSSKEFTPVEKEIVAHATPADVAWILRPMASDAARRAWMSNAVRMPWFVQVLFMMPALRRYNRDVVVPMAALRVGDTAAPPAPDAGCACSIM